jgi:hypothetical protein
VNSNLDIILLSSQASATFLAVVVGFFLSRVLETSSRVRELRHQILSSSEELSRIKIRLSEAEGQVLQEKLGLFSSYYLQDLIDRQGDLQSSFAHWSEVENELPDESIATLFSQEILEIRRLVSEEFGEQETIPDLLFPETLNFQPEFLSAEQVSSTLDILRRHRAQKLRESRELGPSDLISKQISSMLDFENLTTGMNSAFSTIGHRLRVPVVNSSLHAWESEVAQLSEDKSELERNLGKLRRELKAVGSTKGLFSATLSIGAFGMLGVAGPILWLYLNPFGERFNGIVAGVTLLMTIALVTFYLIRQVRLIKATSKEQVAV